MSTTTGTAITGSGVFSPPNVVTTEQLCATFNTWVRRENERNREAIEAGERAALQESSPEFVDKVSGIRARHLWDASGVLDPDRMRPEIPDRPDDALSVQAELALAASTEALESAGRVGEDVDMIVVGASSIQRPYPAVAIEVQKHLRARGFALDVSVGCSSAAYGIQIASDAIRAGTVRCALVCAPELPSAYSNFRDRDSHFILGDAGAAVVIEPKERASDGGWEILRSSCFSRFSSGVRNNGGFLNRCDPEGVGAPDKLFYQDGRRVFRDIVRLVPRLIREQLAALDLRPSDVNRYWLHQANGRMNDAIIERLLGEEACVERAPSALAGHANTASAGALIVFDRFNRDVAASELGVLCAFGAGYTVGGQVLRRF